MGQVRHGCATTTHAVRAAIQRSQASLATLSRELGINPKTVAKWRKRATVDDLKTGPKTPHSTTLPAAPVLLADRGYDADWFRQALAARDTVACIPSRKGRKVPIPHDAVLYQRRHRIENMFGRLKDWRRIHTRYDRCAHAFMSAIALAASFIFWINQ